MLALAADEASKDPAFQDAYVADLNRFARQLPRPRAVVVLSAHGLSQTGAVVVSAAARPMLSYDFRGFPEELYGIQYPCAGEPELARRIAEQLTEAQFKTSLESRTALDHGVWVPLKILYPDANVPVIQITMPYPTDPRYVLKMGRSLSELRREGILLIGSGGAVHNLQELQWHQKHGPGAEWAIEFDRWVHERLRDHDVEGLLEFEEDAPHGKRAHPTPEHFYPLFFAVGAALPGDHVVPIHEGFEYHSLSMFSFAMSQPPSTPTSGPVLH